MRFLPLTMAITVTTVSPSVALGQDAEVSEVQRRLEQYMGYFLRDGGRWVADNPAYEAGGTAPMRFGYEYRWDFHQTVVRNTIYGMLENDVRVDFAESVFAWNPKVGKVEQFLFGNGGGIGRGFENHLADDLIEADFVWEPVTGERLELKDRVRITGPDSFDNETLARDENGQWTIRPYGKLVYRRVRPPL